MSNASQSNIWTINSATSSPDTNIFQQNASNDLLQNETYTQYGLRICGRVTASLPVLSPFLSRIFNSERQQQLNNRQLQSSLKLQLENQLIMTDQKIIAEEASKKTLESQIQDLQTDIKDAEQRLVNAKSIDGNINKMAKLKLIIGAAILVLLTIYLFIFYSSTFYSAFLFNPNESEEVSVGMAMFNAGAIGDAASHGFGTLIFILTAPVIFIGLGYCLHFFMVQTSSAKWFKIASLLFITFTFDCILAYKIGELIYNYDIMTKLGQFPTFSISMAVADINSWAVIFCGFIVYLIWGIVFDMTVTAYEELRSNKHEIQALNREITELKCKEQLKQQKAIEKEAEIRKLTTEKDNLKDRIDSKVFFDLTPIKNALSQFFTGWLQMMSMLNSSNEDQKQAHQIYNDAISQLVK